MLPAPRARPWAAALFAAVPLLAQAQLTGNVALTSDYKFRGQDQDILRSDPFAKTGAFKPAIQGGFDDAFGDSGWYAGNWNSSVNWLRGNSLESDWYGGYKWKAGAIDLDAGALAYLYPGNASGNTTELYGSATYADPALGTFALKYSHTVSDDYFGHAGAKAGSGLSGRNTGYLNLAYNRALSPQLTLKAALGYTRMAGDIRRQGLPSYLDYQIGAAYDFGSGLSLTGTLQGANRQAAYGAATGPAADAPQYSPNKGRFILTLAKTF
ncbi:TorF family putative porin [Acidovorax sp. SUPP3334]|uniref:TorF family putative porin n=1 Tax=Acidovorax sp. SUPP3334 TaxID=2920881 RepID=UPI0024E06B1C|nr:TorF family putative porin [Acidovorax sp. SUPP3334]